MDNELNELNKLNEVKNENTLISEIIVKNEDMDANISFTAIGPQNPLPTPSYTPTFINLYSTSEQHIRQNDFIVFENTNSMYGQCSHTPYTSEIYIWKSGYYSVYTSIYHLESCQFSLLKNSHFIAPASSVGSLSGPSQNNNFFIMQIEEADIIINTPFSPNGYACKLQIINNSQLSYMPYVTLIGSFASNNQLPQITASITIQSII